MGRDGRLGKQRPFKNKLKEKQFERLLFIFFSIIVVF